MLTYLFIKRPLKERVELIQQVCFEILIFVVNLSFFVMAITDRTDGDDTNIIKNTSEIIIILNMIFAFLPLVFLAIRVFLNLVIFYKWLKLNLQKNKRKQKNIPKKEINPRSSKIKRKVAPSLVFAENSEILRFGRRNSSFLEDNIMNHEVKIFQKKQVSCKRIKQPVRISRKDILNGLESHRVHPWNGFEGFPETKTSSPQSHNSPVITRKGTLIESLKTFR